MNWKYGLEIIGDILGIVFSIFLLFHFIQWINGNTYWGEPDKAILAFEIIMSFVIGGIFIERLIDDLKK